MNSILSLEREYDLKKTTLLREKEEILNNAYIKSPRLKQIDDEIRNLGIKTLKLSVSKDKSSSEKEISKLTDNIKKLEKEKAEIIKKEKIVIEPSYECKECKDTGYITVDNHVIMCSCKKQKKIDMYYNKYNAVKLNDEKFENFDYNLYSDKADSKLYFSSISPRENIKKIVAISKKFIEGNDLENKNLLFIGSTGIGKTYLSRMYSK